MGHLTRYLGAPGGGRIDLVTAQDADLPVPLYAVVIVSDGVWEPILSETYIGATLPPDPIAAALAATLTHDDDTADTTDTRIMAAARTAGLDDNATVAVACICGDAERHVI